MDSHAGSQVVGKYTAILEISNKTALVLGLSTELGDLIRVPLETTARIYDCEYTGESHIMVIHNALHFKNMEINLVPPIMMRIAGLEVDVYPKFLAKAPSESNHSIYFLVKDLRIPLQIEGVIFYIPTRKTTKIKIKEREGDYLLLTPNLP